VNTRRRAGVLAHLTSIPGAEHSGALGSAAEHFLDWLREAGVSVWQVLPVGPVGADGSPYYCGASRAGNVRLVDLTRLAEEGLVQLEPRGEEHFARWHARQLAAAAVALPSSGEASQAAWSEFRERERGWLEDYALHAALAERFAPKHWWEWPAPLRDREPAALAAARAELCSVIDRATAEQYLFDRQWQSLRRAAAARGISLFGDLPIYLSPDAVDVWVHRALFELDHSGRPTLVGGVPPDYYAKDGQRWGNPLYRWPAHVASGFEWWLDRLRAQRRLFDILRIDHFRALEAYWAVPAQAATARTGEWQPAPGDDLLARARAAVPDLELVAEDLGIITPAVNALRERHGLPGMRVLQFAFDGDPGNPHLPHNWQARLVAYTGTHDNTTLAGWVAELDPHARARLSEYLGSEALAPALIRALYASVAGLVVVPMQDLLGLPAGARMNTPGTTAGNWRWRFGWEDVPAELAARTREALRVYGRA
jgi:4-alpha-glucanotransferase